MGEHDDDSVGTGELDDEGESQVESWLQAAARVPDGDLAKLLPRPGDVLAGKYRIDEPIGKGGMGAVFAATNQLTEKRVAIKWMLPRDGSKSTSQRFVREARTAGRIDHPNVVDVYDAGEHEGAPFLVMELLRGETLRRRIDRGPLEPTEAVRTLLLAMRGVAAAHGQGVIHRDLKPDNIFLCRAADGAVLEPKVLDFGIAKVYEGTRTGTSAELTRDGTMLGTPAYMPPEQARGTRDLDARADVYALGAILYNALTGRLPYEATSYNALIVKIATEDPERLASLRADLPDGLDSVIERAMARDRDARYPNVESFARALEPFAEGLRFRPQDSAGAGAGAAVAEMSTPTPTPREQTTTARIERSPARAVMLFGALVVALGGGWLALAGRGGGGAGDAARSLREGQPPAAAALAAATKPPTPVVALPGKPDPEHVPACAACAADKCASLRVACEAEPDCAAWLACTSECSDPDCHGRCGAEHLLDDSWRSPTRDAASAFQSYRHCVYDGPCMPECNRGKNYACIGRYRRARVRGEIEVSWAPVAGVFSAVGPSGIPVHVCGMLDPDCDGGPAARTDHRGVATFEVAGGPGGTPFEGFFEVRGRHHHILSFPPPLVRASHMARYAGPGSTTGTFGFASTALGTPIDPEQQGLVFIVAVDCAETWASGLRLSLDPSPEDALGFYFAHGGWSQRARETTGTPMINPGAGAWISGGFVTPPGRYLLRAELADGGTLFAERELVVRAGAITNVGLQPRAR